MSLFSLPKRNTVNEKELVNKVNSSKKSELTIKLGKDSLLTVITNIKNSVETKLSKYKDRYRLVTDKEELNKYIDKILENGSCALDTETTGKNCFQNKIVGASLYTPGEQAIYIPVRHISYITGDLISNNIPLNDFKEAIKRLEDKDLKIIYQNGKFDYKMILKDLDCDLPLYWDTMIAARALNQLESAGLKYQYAKYIENSDEFAKFGELFGNIPFQYIPVNSAYIYGAKDAEMTYELYLNQLERLKNQPRVLKLLLEIEMPIVKAVAETELTGVEIDQEYAKELSIKYNAKLKEAEEIAYKELDKYKYEIETFKRLHPSTAHKLSNPINLYSPDQLAILFYDILKLKSPDRKKPRGTGEEIVETFNNPFCKALLECRASKKLLSTYIDALPNQVESDNRIHCQYNQYGADTGRFSSSEPNLQNIPSHNTEIRKMFKAKDGYCLIGSDFSQQEPRLLSFISGDKHLQQAYRDGKDIYAFIASIAFHRPYESCKEFNPDGSKNPEGKELRGRIKAIVLGIIYSKSVPSIAVDLNISKEEAQNIFDTFFKSFPVVKKFISETQAKVEKLGYAETIWGRRRYLPDMQLKEYEVIRTAPSSISFDPTDFESNEVFDYTLTSQEEKYWVNKMKRAFGREAKYKVINEAANEGITIKDNSLKKQDAERQCVNSVIQGSAADMSKISILKIYQNKELRDLGYRMQIYVHDEIIGECPLENAKRCGELISSIMANSVSDVVTVPFKCDAEYTKCWYGDTIKVN